MALDTDRPSRKAALLTGGALALGAALLTLGYLYAPEIDPAWLERTVTGLGLFGPIALIGLMVLAIVISPIPSGPIAIAAGALYGANGGAAISIIGAETGALIAFSAARYLGFDAIRRSENRFLKFIAVPRSQLALMAIVFASRLIPFLSFDAISYATGLTNLSFGRFALATALGIVPVCWALAAMGAGIATGGPGWALVVVLGGSITLLPVIAALLRARFGS
jgi:uncharacterized membrane protein YdjX (TVP38/TMEM64 family)